MEDVTLTLGLVVSNILLASTIACVIIIPAVRDLIYDLKEEKENEEEEEEEEQEEEQVTKEIQEEDLEEKEENIQIQEQIDRVREDSALRDIIDKAQLSLAPDLPTDRLAEIVFNMAHQLCETIEQNKTGANRKKLDFAKNLIQGITGFVEKTMNQPINIEPQKKEEIIAESQLLNRIISEQIKNLQ